MLSKICLVVSIVALGVMFAIAINAVLKEGHKGLKENSKWIGISFIVYLITFLVFLISH